MFNSKTIILILIFTISTISLGYLNSPVEAAEAIVTSTSTPPPTTTLPPPTTPPPTTTTTTSTPTATPTPCQEKMGCAGIAPTVTPTTSNSVLLFVIGIVLLFVYWIISAVSYGSDQE